MLNNLMSTHPFKQSVQYTAYLLLGCLLVGIALMRPAPKAKIVRKNSLIGEVDIHPATAAISTPPTTPQPGLKSLFKSQSYNFLVGGLCLTCLGVFFPSFYLQIFASEKGVDSNLTSYTVAIINAASTIGMSYFPFLSSLAFLPSPLLPFFTNTHIGPPLTYHARPSVVGLWRYLRPPEPPRRRRGHQRATLFLRIWGNDLAGPSPRCDSLRHLVGRVQRSNGTGHHVTREKQVRNRFPTRCGILDLRLWRIGRHTGHWALA